MTTNYETLTDVEYNVLNKIAEKTKMDCWFYIKQDRNGVDFIWDLEEHEKICLRTGVRLLYDGIGCKENYDNCHLTAGEDKTFQELLEKLNLKKESWL